MAPPEATMRDATGNGKTPRAEYGYMILCFPPFGRF
jgi:hypothetical protein